MEIKDVKFIKTVTKFESKISPLENDDKKAKIFFLGRSNVGKSSMINSLLGKKELAYSGAKAGKTRTINIFGVNKTHECVDFPGYGFAVGGKENQIKLRDMILDYLEGNIYSNLKVVIIIDAFVGPTSQDIEVFDYINEKGVKILIVLNKVDKTSQKELENTKSKIKVNFPQSKYILYSSKNDKYKKSAIEEIFN
ncbi:ribosome biogenesis GTP-binding protein YihA/YsxC [Candidatus Gracilibacteria bacterium]|nr:ribosome biogenesis GTP-binding protein YihA/YsxC [Candidatus Gracilibacteria bacterium]